jgi:hypothetical protein
MRTPATVTVILLALLSSPAALAAGGLSVSGVGFKTPESALHDVAADLYLVSNISGSPVGIDGDGFISQVTPRGKVRKLKWIGAGGHGGALNAPKGLAIAGDTLYVADITMVRRFDRKTGAARDPVAVDGATFLNGLAVGPAGAVYVSDSGMGAGPKGLRPSGSDAIWRVTREGKPQIVIESTQLAGPNGLVAADDGIWVVSFRSNLLCRVAEGKIQEKLTLPKGSLDGLVRLDDGSFLAASWSAQAIFRGKPGGPFAIAVRKVQAPADIAYDAKRKRLLIPLFTDNALRIVPLE